MSTERINYSRFVFDPFEIESIDGLVETLEKLRRRARGIAQVEAASGATGSRPGPRQSGRALPPFDDRDITEITSLVYPRNRLIVWRNGLLAAGTCPQAR